MRDFKLTIGDLNFDKIKSAALTDCASECQLVPPDGIHGFRLMIDHLRFDKINVAIFYGLRE
jgi:hypothetical protein